MKKKFETRAIHVGQKPEELYGSVSLPIYQTSTFKQEEFGEYTYDYSRAGNPTRSALEETIASLEGGSDAAMFSSGMAAMSSIFTLLKQGDHLIISGNVYGGTYRLMTQIMEDMGLSASWIDTADLELLKGAIKSSTKMIIIESPTNPMMQLTDIQAVSKISKEHGLLLVVDNTFMSPYYQRPIEHGADLVMHSTTKYINGHSDVIAGCAMGSEQVIRPIKTLRTFLGSMIAPYTAWLLTRSLETLHLRMAKQGENAEKVVNYLMSHKSVKTVSFPGIDTMGEKQNEIFKRQCLGSGAMISFEVFGGEKEAFKFLNNLKLIKLAVSLGSNESLAQHPYSMTHADVPDDIKLKIGINQGLIRLSVGIENAEDIISDLNNAFKEI